MTNAHAGDGATNALALLPVVPGRDIGAAYEPVASLSVRSGSFQRVKNPNLQFVIDRPQASLKRANATDRA